MPEISRFFGITIKMFFSEHGVPHFHAIYGDYCGVFSIDTLELLEGKLPKRVGGFVLEWASDHRLELRENWELLRKHHAPQKIAPLE